MHLAAWTLMALCQDPAPGATVEKVPCGPDGKYSYACRLPKAYDAKERWPILYCFSPAADGAAFVEFYRDAGETAGWIVVGSNDSKNGPLQLDAITAMWEDTHRRFSIHPKRLYAAGFSGGSRIARWFAAHPKFDPSGFAGLIQCGAALCNGAEKLDPRVNVWYMCGETDFNRREMEQVHAAALGQGRKARLTVFPGEHEMPDPSVGREAVEWHERICEESRPRVLRRDLERARKMKASDPYGAWEMLDRLMKEYDDVKCLDELRTGRDALRDDPVVAEERAAARALEKARALEDDRPKAREAYEAVAKDHPGTRAAEEAGRRLKELKEY